MENKHREAEISLINQFKVELVGSVSQESINVPNEPLYEVVGKSEQVGEKKSSLHSWLLHVYEEVTSDFISVKRVANQPFKDKNL